jgi:N-methylhydantoinase A
MRRIGVDIGGTFTDLVAYDEATGEITTTKVLTTPDAPEEGLLSACAMASVDVPEVSQFMHATTIVTNLIITRSGACVGLITTRGFRDVLEIGRSYRRELYNLLWDKPRHLVPRHLVKEVRERVSSKGTILTPLEEEDVERAVSDLLAAGVESMAVSLFNSYANPLHEHKIGEIIGRFAPGIPVSLACDVDPRIREYPRVSTSVLNAYAAPRVSGYIGRLSRALTPNVRYMHSGGGVLPADEAQRVPISLVASGPAAGVLAARYIGKRAGIRDIVTADTGGTSFDVCVIRGGRPEVKAEVEVEWGIPARVQSIDVNSVGCGGGGIAWVDEGGALRVGPQSAGSNPGPACYGQGGVQPTVTDANLVIGVLNPANMLGGRLKMDIGAAWRAIQPIADFFNVSVPETAMGIHRIVTANMAQAVLEATVRKGIDPRGFTLFAFGGAGGQHAVDVARQVGIPVTLIPPHPAAFSAFGLITADLQNTASKTLMWPIGGLDEEALLTELRGLEDRAGAFLESRRESLREILVDYMLDVRYVGQSNEVAVNVGAGRLDAESIYEEFERLHRVLYGTQLADPAELVNVRVTVTGREAPVRLRREGGPRVAGLVEPGAHREVALFESSIPVYDRSLLGTGSEIVGPAIVEESDSTLVLPKAAVAHVDEWGNLIIGVT